jgi:light-regulated signal transduction histidine kinase (bacteriophytochrome)
MADVSIDGRSSEDPHVAIERISHELRTPLTVVIGFCELLQDERPEDDSIKEFASRIAANAWQLHAAVERLLTELHSAAYTGPPAIDTVQYADDPDPRDPDSVYSSRSSSGSEIADRIDELFAADGSRPSE